MFERFTDQSHRAVVLALAGPEQEPPRGHITFTARAKKGFELALREATRLGQQIGTGHLLLGLTGQADCVAARVLGTLGIDLAALRARVMAETESRPEGQEYHSVPRPRMRPRRVAIPDPVQALLESIDERLSAIERHLGINPGGPENVIPPS
jgi:ATP-dependent Clp protease ATP-binding subunit ClpA